MKNLKEDEYGEDEVMKPLVMIVTFIAIFAILASYAGPIFVPANQKPVNDQDTLQKYFSTTQLGMNEFWYNGGDEQIPYNVTSSDAGTYWNSPLIGLDWGDLEGTGPNTDAHRFDFLEDTEADPRTVYGYLLDPYGQNGDPYWYFYEQWGWWDQKWQKVSYEQIVNNYKEDTYISEVPITLRAGYTVYFIFNTTVDQRTSLKNNEGYMVILGQDALDKAKAATNAWTIVGGLLTFNSHLTGNDVFDFFISVPFWATIIYIAVVLIRSFIPFL